MSARAYANEAHSAHALAVSSWTTKLAKITFFIAQKVIL